jgi:YidC/Oxa1 family membrane protein insertase
VSEPQKKKELSSEMRILIASILSMAVILLWAKFFAPKPPANLPQANKPAITAPAATNPATQPATTSPSTTPGRPNATTPAGVATGIAPSNAASMPPKADAQERTIVVENALYRVEISNRGGVVKSWQLKKYMDDSKPQRVLDVVHPDAAAQVGGWPFALVLDDQQLEAQANSALYVAGIPHVGLQRNCSSLGAMDTSKSQRVFNLIIRMWCAWKRPSSITARPSKPAWRGWEALVI